VSRSKNRPPHLEPAVPVAHEAAPPTPEARLEQAKVAGAGGSGPGPTELRRLLERMAVNDRRSLGELGPMPGLSTDEAWVAVTATYGATPTAATIDVARTLDATRRAAARIVEVGKAGARIAVATTRPASLLTVHMAWARLASAVGANVVDLADFGPIRADGRTPRWLRWIGSVAVVSDGRALCDTADGEAGREWMFAVPRPSLVVADGPFAEVAWEAGIEVIALAGLDRPGLAVAAARAGRALVVPMRTDRAARGYAPIEELIDDTPSAPEAVSDPLQSEFGNEV
jgi:histidinol phosphate phosphatase hisN-like protein